MLKVWRYITQDYARNKEQPKFIFILAFFRLTNWFARERKSFKWFLGIPIMVLYRIIVEDILSVELRASTKVGKGLKIEHGYALVVNAHAVIGDNVHLRHSTTIGCKMMEDGSEGPSPTIGNNVEVGSNSVILGGIKIGDYAKIGSGSVVVHDVPEHSVVVGNPAHVIKKFKNN